jgi:hypothetical protein
MATTDAIGLRVNSVENSAAAARLIITLDAPFSTPSALNVNTTELDFGKVVKGESAPRTFTITNAGGGTLSGTITDDRTWITTDKTSFNSNNQTVSVTVSNSKLTDGQYTGTVTVDAGSAGTETITVNMTATCVFTRPNPYNPKGGNKLTFFGTGVPDSTIKIYTLAGELVKTLKETSGSSTEIEWDGRNESGDEVISGIYLYTTENSTEKNACSFTIIKK